VCLVDFIEKGVGEMRTLIESIALYTLVETAFSNDPKIFDDDGNEYYIKDFVIENEGDYCPRGRCKMTVTLVDCETHKKYSCTLLKKPFTDYYYEVFVDEAVFDKQKKVNTNREVGDYVIFDGDLFKVINYDSNKGVYYYEKIKGSPMVIRGTQKEVKMENKSDKRGDCVGCLIESISLEKFIKKAASQSAKISDDYGNEYYIAKFDLINYKGPGLLKYYIKEVVLLDCKTLKQYNCVLLKKFKGGDLFSLYTTDFEEESAKKSDKATKRKGYAVFLKHEDDLQDHVIIWGRMSITRDRADAARPYLFDTPKVAANAVRHMIERPHWKIQCISYMDLDDNYELESTGV
jgi:exonuclease III